MLWSLVSNVCVHTAYDVVNPDAHHHYINPAAYQLIVNNSNAHNHTPCDRAGIRSWFNMSVFCLALRRKQHNCVLLHKLKVEFGSWPCTSSVWALGIQCTI